MRERNVEIVRSVLAAYNRGDIEGVLAVVSPNVEVVSTPDMPNDGRFEGHEGFMTWLTQWLEAWAGSGSWWATSWRSTIATSSPTCARSRAARTAGSRSTWASSTCTRWPTA